MQVRIVGPNLPRPFCDQGTLHVHKEGCRDLRKFDGSVLEQEGWTLEASTIHEVIVDIYPPDNFDYNDTDPGEYSAYRTDVYVAPCVTIPEEA